MDPFLLDTCWRILCTAERPWQEESMFSLSSKLGIQHFHQSSMQLRYIQSKISRDQKPTKKMVCYSAWKSTHNKLHGIHLLSCYTIDLVYLLQKILFCSTYFSRFSLSVRYHILVYKEFYLNPYENISWCHDKHQINVRGGEELAWRSVCPTSILVGRS